MLLKLQFNSQNVQNTQLSKFFKFSKFSRYSKYSKFKPCQIIIFEYSYDQNDAIIESSKPVLFIIFLLHNMMQYTIQFQTCLNLSKYDKILPVNTYNAIWHNRIISCQSWHSFVNIFWYNFKLVCTCLNLSKLVQIFPKLENDEIT